jgi:phosphoribosylaminoimidazole-succinocarboxamide synthase
MGLENLALEKTDNLPIKHEGNVHSGKVRSVYWLTSEDGQRLIAKKGYNIDSEAGLGVMVISDRLSAFDVIWHAEQGLRGVPGKGASLNAISKYWFDRFEEAGIGKHHILEMPHPLVWVVQKAEPVMIEAIARQYITGSMWRDYKNGAREICGIPIPDGLKEHQRLPDLLITPSTKGVLRGIPGVPEEDDTNVTRQQIVDNATAFGFASTANIEAYEFFLRRGFGLIERELAERGQIFVDTKFEFGYLSDSNGRKGLGFIDEIGTPDSSRIWGADEYAAGKVVEKSKEDFRQFLLGTQYREILLDKKRMPERRELAKTWAVPVAEFMKVSDIYTKMAETITGRAVQRTEDPRQEIVEVLNGYGLIR